MREDFNKLLCERERPRSWDKYSNYRHVKNFKHSRDGEEFSDLPSREGMKKRYGYDSKVFNENLNPLYKFVHARVGKKWDKVYSEICSTFDKRSVINQHILIHLFQYVETKIILDHDGKLKWLDTYFHSEKSYRDINEGYFDYYVDPRNGVLCFNKRKITNRQRSKLLAKRRADALLETKRTFTDGTVLINDEYCGGCWFKEIKVPYIFVNVIVDKETKEETYVPETRYRTERKQLNKKELKFYNVTNKPVPNRMEIKNGLYK